MNSSQIKLVAIIAMFLDHAGLFFFPDVLWLRLVGRISFPLFAWSVANGYLHTRNAWHYLMRLAVFAAISQLPYWLVFRQLGSDVVSWDAFVTLAVGLGAVMLASSQRMFFFRLVIVLTLAFIVQLVGVDYGGYGVLLIAIYYFSFGKIWLMLGGHALVILMFYGLLNWYGLGGGGWMERIIFPVLVQMFSLWALFFVHFYNGKLGAKFGKWMYWVYPAHLLVIWLIFVVLFKY